VTENLPVDPTVVIQNLSQRIAELVQETAVQQAVIQHLGAELEKATAAPASE